MASKQIQIDRKALASKSAVQSRRNVETDLRTPSGKKLPY